ncbi:MAG: 50S ribosomal protein L25 [bacterium]|nr:50S ribosomal protein L25 [bacterium]
MTQLKVQERPKDKSANELRRSGMIPAVVYHQGKEAFEMALNYIKFEKLYESAGESTLIDLVMPDETKKKVLINDVQKDSMRGRFIHVDFYEVDITKKVKVPVEINYIGEAPVVKTDNGVVMKLLDEIEIECLPNDLIQNIEVDLSVLTAFDSAVHVADLKVPSTITIINHAEDVVVNIAEPKLIEEEKPVVEEAAADGQGEAKTDAAGGKENAETGKEENKK